MGDESANPLSFPLSRNGRLLILAVGFLGWLCAGMHMSITQLMGQAAAVELLDRTGTLDLAQYEPLSRQAQAAERSVPGARKLTVAERTQLGHWRALAGQWFAW